MLKVNKYGTLDSPESCNKIEPYKQLPDTFEDVVTGLLEPPRQLSPKYFYDDHGSLLFDRICGTDEYYLTRTEEALLTTHSTDIITQTMPNQILELGSGVSHKIRLLLDACEKFSHACEYAPFDVCEEIVILATRKLSVDYHWLDINPMVGDYHAGLGNLPKTEGVRLVAFLGSTIGNFTREERDEFILEIKQCLQPGDYFLIGADRVKDSAILNAAYNDADGITAEFNLNLLRVLNREIKTDFNLENFSHYAFYNEDRSQIEMYLVSSRDQEVKLGDNGPLIKLAAGERILTEISRKYNAEELESMLVDRGFRIVRHYQPTNRYFSLLLARVE